MSNSLTRTKNAAGVPRAHRHDRADRGMKVRRSVSGKPDAECHTSGQDADQTEPSQCVGGAEHEFWVGAVRFATLHEASDEQGDYPEEGWSGCTHGATLARRQGRATLLRQRGSARRRKSRTDSGMCGRADCLGGARLQQVYDNNLALMGGFAEYGLAPDTAPAHKPAQLTFAEASTIP